MLGGKNNIRRANMNKSLELHQAMEILQSAPCGILILDSQQNIVWHNKIAGQYFESSSDELLGKCIKEITDVNIKSLLENEITPLSDIKNQGTIWLRTTEVPIKDGIVYYFTDVTEQQKLEYRYSQLKNDQPEGSMRDSITGLLNKQGLMQALDNQVSRSRRYNNPLSLIRMDIIDFDKFANKTQILTAIGHFLNDQLRWADMAGRTNNDKFLFILPETQKEAAKYLAAKISEQLSTIRIDANKQPVSMNIYYGVTSWNKGDDTAKLIKRVEQKLAVAKKEAAIPG